MHNLDKEKDKKHLTYLTPMMTMPLSRTPLTPTRERIPMARREENPSWFSIVQLSFHYK